MYKFNPLTGRLDYYKAPSGFTGDLNDSTSTKIADVVNGQITAVNFSISTGIGTMIIGTDFIIQ